MKTRSWSVFRTSCWRRIYVLHYRRQDPVWNGEVRLWMLPADRTPPLPAPWSTVSPHLGTNILQRAEGGVDFEVARVACFLRSGRRLDRCRQQMGEIGNQEQTIGDSGDDWRRRRSLWPSRRRAVIFQSEWVCEGQIRCPRGPVSTLATDYHEGGAFVEQEPRLLRAQDLHVGPLRYTCRDWPRLHTQPIIVVAMFARFCNHFNQISFGLV